MGASGLHAVDPGWEGRRARRPERSRQDDAPPPRCRPALAEPGSIASSTANQATSQSQLAKVGFVAQDTPTYAGLSITKHLRMGA